MVLHRFLKTLWSWLDYAQTRHNQRSLHRRVLLMAGSASADAAAQVTETDWNRYQ